MQFIQQTGSPGSIGSTSTSSVKGAKGRKTLAQKRKGRPLGR